MFSHKQRCSALSNSQEYTLNKETQSSQASELANGERYENGQRVKTLPPSVIKDI